VILWVDLELHPTHALGVSPGTSEGAGFHQSGDDDSSTGALLAHLEYGSVDFNPTGRGFHRTPAYFACSHHRSPLLASVRVPSSAPSSTLSCVLLSGSVSEIQSEPGETSSSIRGSSAMPGLPLPRATRNVAPARLIPTTIKSALVNQGRKCSCSCIEVA